LEKLEEKMIPPISEFDGNLQLTWCIPRKITAKRTATGKEYFQVEVVDSNSAIVTVRCWGVDVAMGDRLEVNKPYLVKPDYNDEWGFSTRGRIGKFWKCLAS